MPDRRPDPAAFEALALPLFDSLYNFAHWLTQRREDAEDLVQETFSKALKGFGSFQPGTNFRAWIFRILRNTFLTSRAGLAASATTLPLSTARRAARAREMCDITVPMGTASARAISRYGISSTSQSSNTSR